jgi:hypothetical protein
LRILFYTTGFTGSGRISRGIAIGNALMRKSVECRYAILSSSHFAHLCDLSSIENIYIPGEDANLILKYSYRESYVYRAITEFDPDLLIVDLAWYALHYFLRELQCRKIFLCRQVFHDYFSIEFQGERISLDPGDYDHIFSIEPFKTPFEMTPINPFLLKNKDEILSRENAAEKLKLEQGIKTCLLYCNGEPGEYEKMKDSCSYLENEGYRMIYSSNYNKGLFPVVDYFNAADCVVCGGGYNSFWETKYFQKDAIYFPVERNFESQEYRVRYNRDFSFEENGADQLVDCIKNF